jgi:hypothetical protein
VAPDTRPLVLAAQALGAEKQAAAAYKLEQQLAAIDQAVADATVVLDAWLASGNEITTPILAACAVLDGAHPRANQAPASPAALAAAGLPGGSTWQRVIPVLVGQARQSWRALRPALVSYRVG